MYTTCTFCYAHLGENTSLEYFQVARRVAFDANKGCIWAVCPRCARWNLAPIEERWEAVEECERRFRETSLRYTSGNIGLAVIGDGVELVRVGAALRPEVAAWRYGRVLTRKRSVQTRLRERVAAMFVGAYQYAVGQHVSVVRDPRAAAARLFLQLHGNRILDVVQLGPAPSERVSAPFAVIRYQHLVHASLVRPQSGEPWALHVPHDDGELVIGGESGIRAASRALAIINGTQRGGGFSHTMLREAARRVDESAHVDTYFNRVLAIALRASWGGPSNDEAQKLSNSEARKLVVDLEVAQSQSERLAFRLTGRSFWARGGIGSEPYTRLLDIPLVDRLAIEMAAHEETERRALEGELKELEAAWREADEIATIADSLLP